MKRLVAFVVVLALCVILPLSVFADMDAPSIESYYVFVGPDGLSIKYYDYNIQAEKKMALEFGQKIKVYDKYEDETGTIQWQMVLENKDKTEIWFSIDDAELKNTLPDGKDFSTENAKKSDEKTVGKIIGQPGLNLRMGPATGFDSKGLIPYDTEVTYQYTYDNWGYVTYEGKTGWVSLDYVEKTGNIEDDIKEEKKETDTSAEQFPDENAGSNTLGTGLFSTKSGKIIILCLIGGLIIAVTALVIILIIIIMGKNKKANEQPNDDNILPPFDNF